MVDPSPDPATHEESAEERLEGMVPGYPDAVVAIERGQRKRKWKRALVALVLSFAAATLCAELFLRFSGYRENVFAGTVNSTISRWVGLMQAGVYEEIDDPVRRYAMRPGAETEVEGWTFRVSSSRARGPELASPKPATERRLLALGDSFCFGLWCDEDETLVGHLTRMANERETELASGLTWQAVNLGVPGYHSGQQLRSFEQEGLALEPDVVVIYYNTNDIQTNGFFFDPQFGLRNDYLPLPVWLKRALWSSHLYGAIVRWHYMQYQELASPEMDPRVPWAHVREDNQRETKAALARIVELCRERDLPVYFVNQPLLTWLGAMRDPDWDGVPLVEWAETVRAELGIPGTNLMGWARGYGDGVDRFQGLAPGAALPEPDFLLDKYFADVATEAALAWVREKAVAEGRVWDELPYTEQLMSFGTLPPELVPPQEIDFHLSGDGYGHIARVVYPGMQAAGMLP